MMRDNRISEKIGFGMLLALAIGLLLGQIQYENNLYVFSTADVQPTEISEIFVDDQQYDRIFLSVREAFSFEQSVYPVINIPVSKAKSTPVKQPVLSHIYGKINRQLLASPVFFHPNFLHKRIIYHRASNELPALFV